MIEQKRFDFVDALRGIAILLVILAHTPVPNEIAPISVVGAYGVQLFFVVSAFTLFLSLDVKYSKEARPILFFYIRRFFRIAPAFYFAAVFYLLKDGLSATPWAPNGIHFWQIATTLLFINGWHPESINAVVPGGWSIAVEMTFYIFVPLCFMFVKNAYRALFLAVGLAIMGEVANRMFVPHLLAPYPPNGSIAYYFPQLWFPSEACVFPVGFILFFLFKNQIGMQAIDRRIATGLVCVSGYLLLALSTAQFTMIPRHFLYAGAFGLFCFALSRQTLRVFVNPVICYIGKISFSIYLFHFFAIDLVKAYIVPLLGGSNPYSASAMFYLCSTTCAAAIASVTYYFLEKPGQNVGRCIIARIESGIAKSLTAAT